MQCALILLFAAAANAHFEWTGERGLELGTYPGGPVMATFDSEGMKQAGKVADKLGFNIAANIEDKIGGIFGLGKDAHEKDRIQAEIQKGRNEIGNLVDRLSNGARVNLTNNGGLGGRLNLTNGGRLQGGLGGLLGLGNGGRGQGGRGNNGGFNLGVDTGRLNFGFGGRGRGNGREQGQAGIQIGNNGQNEESVAANIEAGIQKGRAEAERLAAKRQAERLEAQRQAERLVAQGQAGIQIENNGQNGESVGTNVEAEIQKDRAEAERLKAQAERLEAQRQAAAAEAAANANAGLGVGAGNGAGASISVGL